MAKTPAPKTPEPETRQPKAPEPKVPEPKVWGGTTLDQRRDERRTRLLAAGLELMGVSGSPAVTVRSLCRVTQLTDRYFYENFDNREALLVAVYDQVAEAAQRTLLDALAGLPDDASAGGRARAASVLVEAFVGYLQDDPRRGRILLLEQQTEPALHDRGTQALRLFITLTREEMGRELTLAPLEAEFIATAIVGALSGVLIRWLDGDLVADRAEVTAFCARLVLMAIPLAEAVDPL